MLTLDNLPIIIILSILLWNFKSILTMIIVSTKEYDFANINLREEKNISNDIELIIKPYASFLLSKGFEYQHVVLHDSPEVGMELDHHIYYFYHPTKRIHALINTLPEKGFHLSAYITYHTFYKSKKIALSTDGMKFIYPIELDNIAHFDHHHGSLEQAYLSHIQDREIPTEEIDDTRLTLEGHIAYEEYITLLTIEKHISNGIYSQSENGFKHSLSWQTFNYTKRVIKGLKESIKVHREGQDADTLDDDTQTSQAHALLGQLHTKTAPSQQKSKIKWFLISMVVSMMVLIPFDFPIIDIAMIIVILLIHELGHFFAMRYFGYTDTNIFFIPLFGAAATGKKEKTTAWQEYIIYLAGPLPGILLGIAVVIYLMMSGQGFMTDGSLWSQFALLSILINYFNLLPIFPLDGGKIVQTLLLLRYPKGQFFFYLLSLAIIVLSIFWLQSFFIIIFALAITFMFKSSYLLSTLLEKLLKKSPVEQITDMQIANLLTSDKQYHKASLAQKVSLATQAIRIINAGKPSKLFMFLGLGFYLLLLGPPFIAMGLLTQAKSGFNQLPIEVRTEVNEFSTQILSYQELTKSSDENYTMEESMAIIDKYLINSQEPLKVMPSTPTGLPCSMPIELTKIHRWHNGIDEIIPYSKLYSYHEVKEKYLQNNQKSNGLISFISDIDNYGVAYSCTNKALYYFDPYFQTGELLTKEYYSFNHFLKIIAEAYQNGAYYRDEKGVLLTDDKKLIQIRQTYLSTTDRKRYEEMIAYLKIKADEYQHSEHVFLKKYLLRMVERTYDKRLIASVQPYLEDEDKSVVEEAIYTLESLE